jgi:hypothetical protein
MDRAREWIHLPYHTVETQLQFLQKTFHCVSSVVMANIQERVPVAQDVGLSKLPRPLRAMIKNYKKSKKIHTFQCP